jgi:phosphonopyruvate decarboxylase
VIEADTFLTAARERGFGLYTGVPCSYLKPFINRVIDSQVLRYVGAANEGDAVAIAAGAELGGMRAVALFQNSGLGNAVNPLTSLTETFRIPILVITTLRGDPDGDPDEPQHARMGAITREMLDLMGIPWEHFPSDNADIPAALERAVRHMESKSTPYALVMKKGTAAPSELLTVPEVRATFPPPSDPAPAPSSRRREMLEALRSSVRADDVIIASTGYTGRELYATGDRDNQLYMVGSMGCASSLGLGLAIARPDRRVIVLDGDGAALMRMGAMATIGHERPANLMHILFDNGIHESTGGQATVSRSIDFRAIASACGYPSVHAAATGDELSALVAPVTRSPAGRLTFVHVPLIPGVGDGLPRPSISPPEIAARLRSHLS